MPTGQYKLSDAKPLGAYSLADAKPVEEEKVTTPYEQLRNMLMAPDPQTRADGQALAKTLTPQQQQEFFDYQKQANKVNPDTSPDRNMVSIGSVGIAPEDVLAGGMAARGIVRAATSGGLAGAVRATAATAAPVVGATIGGKVAGGPGAVVGGVLGALAGGRIAGGGVPAEPPPPTEAERTAALLSSTKPIKAFDYFKMLRTLPPDVQKQVLAARQAALDAEQAAPAPTTASVAAAAPVEAPAAAQAAPSAPIAALPAPPVTRSVFTPGEALSAARQAFEAAGERPRAAELSNVAAMMKFGKSAEQAVAEVIANRPKLSPAEEFNATFGLKTPSGNDLRFPKGMRGASTGGYQ